MSQQELKVRAAAGRRVPMERSWRQIGEQPVIVPATQYYLRRLAEGELVRVEEQR